MARKPKLTPEECAQTVAVTCPECGNGPLKRCFYTNGAPIIGSRPFHEKRIRAALKENP